MIPVSLQPFEELPKAAVILQPQRYRREIEHFRIRIVRSVREDTLGRLGLLHESLATR